MIFDMISGLLSILIIITILLWLPSLMLKSLPKNKKYKNLITQLDKINKGIKKIWYCGFFAFGLIIKAIISAFVGINVKPIIYALNYPLGEGYALWASYAIAGLTFYLLPDFFKLKFNEEVGG